MTAHIKTFEQEGLIIRFVQQTSLAKMIWMGVSDSRDPSKFLGSVTQTLLAEVHETPFEIDLRSLEYMNSATLGPLMSFIKALDQNGVQTVLRFNTAVDWQRINCQCMKAVVRTLKHISVEGK
ncbi:MAG TPA: hypothetical protein PKE31_09980 [Pseudomonadota bacterium]|nr:hypothetical protein [Pseudomonadota bacterium]